MINRFVEVKVVLGVQFPNWNSYFQFGSNFEIEVVFRIQSYNSNLPSRIELNFGTRVRASNTIS